MDAIWIVVANKGQACIYGANRRGEGLNLIDEFGHEAGKAHIQELVSDAPGRVHDRQGAARHSMEPDVGFQQDSIRRFARKIVDYLEAGADEGLYDRLIFVAAPAFLGIIRKCVDRQLDERIILEIPKNIAGKDVAKLSALLDREL